MRLSENPDANYYAYPLDVCAEVTEQVKVTRIYHLPSGQHDRINSESKKFDRRKIHSGSEYHPEFIKARSTTRQLYVVQPQVPSLDVIGNLVTWEKWTMRVGFKYREGLTFHDIRYDGRSLFYRLSLSEMFVP